MRLVLTSRCPSSGTSQPQLHPPNGAQETQGSQGVGVAVSSSLGLQKPADAMTSQVRRGVQSLPSERLGMKSEPRRENRTRLLLRSFSRHGSSPRPFQDHLTRPEGHSGCLEGVLRSQKLSPADVFRSSQGETFPTGVSHHTGVNVLPWEGKLPKGHLATSGGDLPEARDAPE